jgi:hypothetical protein
MLIEIMDDRIDTLWVDRRLVGRVRVCHVPLLVCG